MPSYKVIEQGFFNGELYKPNGKRSVLHTDEEFPKGKDKKEQVPSWLERIKDETAAEKKKRVATEKKDAVAAKKKAADDQKDISDASFMGDGENSASVETL